MSERSLSVRVLAAVALIGGILQLVATVRLGFAPLGSLQAAAGEGADAYLLLAAALILGGWTIWRLRHRWLLAAVLAVLWQAAVFWPLHDRLSGLGLVFHGESLLHHFLALMSTVVIASIVVRWWVVGFGPRPLRWMVIVAVFIGLPLLAAAHVTPLVPQWPSALSSVGAAVGSAAALALWPMSWAALVLRAPRRRVTWIAFALTIPTTLRIATSGWRGLQGEPVPDPAIPWIVTSLVGASAITFFLFRPKVTRSGRIFSVFVSAIATSILYILYRKRFGELEESLGGLHQSLFAFHLPYPPYVDPWQLIAVMIAVFFILTATYSGLMSDEDRGTGIALGLLVISGIGFTTPQLVLMATAGFLLLIEEGRGRAIVPVHAWPLVPVTRLMEEAASRLGLPDPVILEQSAGQVSAVRGDLEGLPVQVRVRVRKDRPLEVLVHVGVLGRDRPEYELEPRPTHDDTEGGMVSTHRVRGPARVAERIPDAVWQAFAPFPTSHAKFWATGTEVILGPDVAALNPERLEQLIRALRRLSD